jgi:lipopolysaccharide/colanic/teichoic acid biosynthesis glycosyltransferase
VQRAAALSGGKDAAARPGMRSPEARRLSGLVGMRVAPAVVAGGIAALHAGRPGDGALVMLAVFVASGLAQRSRFPLGLMPAAHLTLALAGPFLGIVAALVLDGLAGSRDLSPGELVAPLVGAWLVLGLGAWIRVGIEERLRIRIGVVGDPGFAADLAHELRTARGVRGYDVVGWIGPRSAGQASFLRHLATIDQVRAAVLQAELNLLVCAPHRSDDPADEEGTVPARVADACLDLPVRMVDGNQLYEELLGHVPLGTTSAAWFRYIMHPRFKAVSPGSKRVFDLVGVVVIGLLMLPVLVMAALAVKLGDGGPVLYRQRRLGERGREFELLKLRTMVPEAEPDGARWSEADDERVTTAGRVLRRTHIDELPQLWNVLRSQMTLVGPRPERPEFVTDLERQHPFYARRLLIKPGIAGWAQLRCGYAGSDLGSGWKLCHDIFYVKRRSILGDLLILLETAVVVSRDAHRALPEPPPRFIVREEVRG